MNPKCAACGERKASVSTYRIPDVCAGDGMGAIEMCDPCADNELN